MDIKDLIIDWDKENITNKQILINFALTAFYTLIISIFVFVLPN